MRAKKYENLEMLRYELLHKQFGLRFLWKNIFGWSRGFYENVEKSGDYQFLERLFGQKIKEKWKFSTSSCCGI